MGRSISRRAFIGGSALGAVAATTTGVGGAMASESTPMKLDRSLSFDEINTPALLVDIDAMEANLRRAADFLKSKGVGLRPHTKTHKCPIIAKKQIELGAVGVCAAKVSEAEVMVDAGVNDVLITSVVVTREKIDRVIALAVRSSGIQMVVDTIQNADDFNAAAEAAGTKLRVLIALDTGTRRVGIATGKPAMKLLEHISRKCNSLQFDGLQAYAGHVMHIKGHEKRKARSFSALEHCLETKAKMEKAGHEIGVFTGGGTGTYDIDSALDGMTDLQMGSYLFMDVQYRAIGDSNSKVFDDFAPSLYVLSTAISQPVPTMITIDAGYKAFAAEGVRPEFKDLTGVIYNWGGDEHGMCMINNPSREVHVGDKFQLLVSHCDPTVNLYDYYHPHRNGVVEELWPIAARGKSQ